MTPSRFIAACASVLLALAACGGGGGGGGGGSTPPVVTPPPTQGPARGITVLAGETGGYGNADGPVGRFGLLQALAIDRNGVLYAGNVTLGVGTVRSITLGASGEATVGTRWTGVEGPPVALAADASGNLIGIVGNHILRIAPDGSQIFLAGAWIDGTADGQGEQARFSFPKDLAIDSAGLIWVADGQAIRTVTATGEVRTHAAATAALSDVTGTQNGQPVLVRRTPMGLAFDSAGNLVIAVAGANARKVTPAGLRQDTALPAGAIAADRNGALYAFTTQCALYKLDAAGQAGLLAGSPTRRGQADGAGAEASFGVVADCDGRIVSDSAGNVFVTDVGVVRKVTPGGIVSTVAGKAPHDGRVDGAGSAARFNEGATGLSFDGKDSLYLVQESRVRRITRAGAVTTLNLPATDGSQNQIGYFTGGMAWQGSVVGVANRVVYLADDNGGLRPLATLPQQSEGSGEKAEFDRVNDVTRDGAGNFYLLDTYQHRTGSPSPFIDWSEVHIRKLTPAGALSTVYKITYSYDPQQNHDFVPTRIVADKQGNLFASNGNKAVLRIGADGASSTMPTDLDSSLWLAVDTGGGLYLANNYQQPTIVEKIGAAGQVQVIAGRRDQFGLITGALPGSLNRIYGMTVDDQGVIYVLTENAVVKIVP